MSTEYAICPKCKSTSGNDWRQCEGECPMPSSPHFRPDLYLCPLQATKRHLCPECGSRLEMTTIIDVGSNRQAKFKTLVDWIIAPIDQCPLCAGMKGKADVDVQET